MNRVAEDVFQVRLAPRDMVNAYLLGDVLVDAGTKGMGRKAIKALQGSPLSAHAVTHAHPDHIGGSKRVADAFDVPVWVPERDAADARAGRLTPADTWFKVVASRVRFDAVEVARTLSEGDELAHGFTVLDVPGHSPGHVAYWRESDRTLVCGDVFFHCNIVTTAVGLHQPPRIFTVDPERNRESMRRLAALEPALVLFGHGPPLRDPERLKAFAAL